MLIMSSPEFFSRGLTMTGGGGNYVFHGGSSVKKRSSGSAADRCSANL